MILVFKITATMFFVTVAAYTLIVTGKYLFCKKANNSYYSIDDDWDAFEKFWIFFGLWSLAICLMLIGLSI